MLPDKQTLMKIGLANGQIPKYLYKYTSIDVLKLILQNRTLKFSTISEFNDKRECFSILNFDCTAEEWRQYISGINPESPAEVIQSMVDKIIQNPDLGKQWITDAIKDTNKNLGILCLTINDSNELMWAHYADKHSGACLEFEVSKSIETFCFPKKVEYDDDVKRYNYVRSWIKRNNTGIIDTLFHKSANWAYEEEYRVLRIDGAGLVDFNIESLTSICFAVDTSKDEISEIKRLCKDYGYNHIQFRQNVLNQETGKYEIKELI